MTATKEPLSEMLTLTLTLREKTSLARMAYERGATMSGLIGKMIRDAAGSQTESNKKGARNDEETDPRAAVTN